LVASYSSLWHDLENHRRAPPQGLVAGATPVTIWSRRNHHLVPLVILVRAVQADRPGSLWIADSGDHRRRGPLPVNFDLVLPTWLMT
jgi:hypothetical protein